MNVLVAEDDEICGHYLVKLLSGIGYDSFWFKDGRQAFEWYQQNYCPIIISDWMMPGMDGISLCVKIRELRLPTYSYFILLTAKIPQSEGIRVREKGVDAFLAKPVAKEDLVPKLAVAHSMLALNSQQQATS